MNVDMDELLHRLGGISADRVLLDPAPGLATENDVVRLALGCFW